MGADNVKYQARIKCKKENMEEIRDTLIKGFINLNLSPDESFWSDNEEGWKTLFEEKNDYLEMYILNCYGNYGYAMEYIKEKFVKEYLMKEHPDVLFEFLLIVDDPDYRSGDRIVYDGKKFDTFYHGVATDGEGYDLDAICPECGGKLKAYGNWMDEVVCLECYEEFDGNDLGLDMDEINEDIEYRAMSDFDKHINFKLIK